MNSTRRLPKPDGTQDRSLLVTSSVDRLHDGLPSTSAEMCQSVIVVRFRLSRHRRSIFDGANRQSLFEDDERLMEMRRARGHAFAFNKRESRSAVAFVPASSIARN